MSWLTCSTIGWGGWASTRCISRTRCRSARTWSGVVDSGRPGPTLVLTGHIDTKPVCVGWTDDPYSGRLADGRLHGHAVMDMKAGVAGVVEAGAAMARERSTWRGRILVAAVADHMGQQQGAIRFFEEHAADYCLLAELTDLDIYLGHRGRLYWDITSIGRAAHTCHRHLARQRDREDGAADRGDRGASLPAGAPGLGRPSCSGPSCTPRSAGSTVGYLPAARR